VRNDGFWLSAVGAPEEILTSSDSNGAVEEELRNETAKGRRVIAVAEKKVSAKEADLPFSELESNWDFVGLVSIEDPPRQGVKETIETAHRAGIRTIMVTGDHPQTAAYIAKSVSIPSERVLTGEELDRLSDEELQKVVKEVSVFARTTPEHKYRLVKALHANNEVVAVTGDGVNDTLALKGADVGIAMGIKGTDAAKEAADVVLTDDNFVTIGQAIFEGRKFFDNLRKGLSYYLSVKAALISIFLLPLVLGVPLPFAPIQIIVLELFMDLAASAGFVTEPAERTIYSRKPRDSKAKFPDSGMIVDIAVSAASLFAAVMLSYFYARWQNLSNIETQTFAFSAWIMGHVILAFVSRSEKEPLYILGPLSNRVMDVWAVLAFSFLLVAVSVPSVGLQLRLSALTASQLGLIFAFALLTIVWREIAKLLLFRPDLIYR
jgi:Ca2+-transporting ATPase